MRLAARESAYEASGHASPLPRAGAARGGRTIVRRRCVAPFVWSGPMTSTLASLPAAFGQVLRRVRTEREISQQTLAFECELDRTYISLLERGLRQPTLTTLVLLGSALSIDPAELVRQTLAMKPVPRARARGTQSRK